MNSKVMKENLNEEVEALKNSERKILDKMMEILGEGSLNFCDDGIINNNSFIKERKRVLFILKECAYWPATDKDGRDRLISCLREGEVGESFRKTWHPVSIWARTILEPDWEYKGLISERFPNLISYLQRTAFINLKKTSNIRDNSRSRYDEIKNFVFPKLPYADKLCGRTYANMLREQIVLYKPDMIICCGKSLGTIVFKLFEENPNEWKYGKVTFAPGINKAIGKRVGIVELLHPSYLGNRKKGISYLDKYRELKDLLTAE